MLRIVFIAERKESDSRMRNTDKYKEVGHWELTLNRSKEMKIRKHKIPVRYHNEKPQG